MFGAFLNTLFLNLYDGSGLISDIKLTFGYYSELRHSGLPLMLVSSLWGSAETTAIFTLVKRVCGDYLCLYPDGRPTWFGFRTSPARRGNRVPRPFATDPDEIRRESRLFESVGGGFTGS